MFVSCWAQSHLGAGLVSTVSMAPWGLPGQSLEQEKANALQFSKSCVIHPTPGMGTQPLGVGQTCRRVSYLAQCAAG